MLELELNLQPKREDSSSSFIRLCYCRSCFSCRPGAVAEELAPAAALSDGSREWLPDFAVVQLTVGQWGSGVAG